MIFIICFLNEFTFHNTQGWSLQAPIYLYFYATYIQSIWKGQNIKQLQTISTVCTMFCFPSEGHVWNLSGHRDKWWNRSCSLPCFTDPTNSKPWFLVI